MRFTNMEKNKLEDEWYRESKFKKNHILNSALFYSEVRNKYAYETAKSYLPKLLYNIDISENCKLLLAPVGNGDDYQYIKHLTKNVYGIDISPTAIRILSDRIDVKVNAQVGDILKMPYPDGEFDVIICCLFFHHINAKSYEIYLKELKRVLKRGGLLLF